MAIRSVDSGLRTAVTDAIDVAIGRSERFNPSAPTTGGPAGNARLTAWTGLLLLVLSLVELVTLLDVSGLISWHIFFGTLLLPPALLKTGSTGWRIARYYTGNHKYRRPGPPPMLLRILGPLVVLSTLGLLASGLVLIALGTEDSRTTLIAGFGQRIDALTIHKLVFLMWIVVTGLHVLARFVPALQLTATRTRAADPTAGRLLRVTMVVGALAAGIGLAAIILAASGEWVSRQPHALPRSNVSLLTISRPLNSALAGLFGAIQR